MLQCALNKFMPSILFSLLPSPHIFFFSMGTWYFFVNAAKKKKNTPFTIKEEERGARG
jgi:hypothetical protein